MNLRQQIINERIAKTAKLLNIEEGVAFLRYAHSLITDRSIHVFDQADLVDGGQDKQIDVFTIDQDDKEATVYLLQVKNTITFSSNALIQMHNGLNWIFTKQRKDVEQLKNIKFKDKIIEYRSILGDIGPANITVVVAFIANGKTTGSALKI